MLNSLRTYPLITTKPRQQHASALETSNSQPMEPNALADLAARFDPISLAEMDAAALLDRTDVKFVMPVDQLLNALDTLQGDYRALSVNGRRLNRYSTLYFDTDDFDLYHQTVNDRAERYKVRSREYTDSGLAYLEVKHKTRTGRTIKERVRTSKPVMRLNAEAEAWLDEVVPFDSGELAPKLWSTFARLTLVNTCRVERVTLDVDLTFFNPERAARLDGIAVAEVKRSRSDQASPFLAQMRSLRIQPARFSKYTMGTALLYDNVKKNVVKSGILWLNKLTGGIEYD